jgi:integrative and conjugative element protein (TIGR02256 family)
MTGTQEYGLEQLRAVEAKAGGLFNVDGVTDAEKAGDYVRVKVTVSCANLERGDGGLPLEAREQMVILIPANFPFAKPDVLVEHDRFAGFPHVQWKHSLCLYQAPSTEWNPSDGMFGFLDRLYLWLKQGALGQLDPTGAPLHPPVAYGVGGPTRTVIPRVDTPPVEGEPWFGTAHLRVFSEVRVDIVGWSVGLDRATPQGVAAAILLPDLFPYEFPTNVGSLITALADRGVSRERLFLTLQWAAIHNGYDSPLYVLIGTPMRGIEGGQRRQHLTAWYVDPIVVRALRSAIDKYGQDDIVREYGEKIERLIIDWAQVAPVEWCNVKEDRPEIVIRRDKGSPIARFAGRTVTVWGCGALGGPVAEYLARAGVKKLILQDNGTVTPGVLVRQPFDDADIGRTKAEATRDRLLRVRPDLEIETSTSNLLDGTDAAWGGAEVIIDATASTPILTMLEQRRWTSDVTPPPVISMAIGHDAGRGMVAVALPTHSGGPLDVCRRLKLEGCADANLLHYLDEFWPTGRRAVFQPEPGCSDATFVGSAADVAGLAAVMLNRAAADLSAPRDGVSATGHFMAQPRADGEPMLASFSWAPDHVSYDVHADYVVRISPRAWGDMRLLIEKSRDEVGAKVETGGLLFGERDDAAGVIWVSEVSGPPPDSTASEKEFVCGIAGTADMNTEKRTRSRGSVHYLGMWHTHPSSAPVPSPTDFGAMFQLLAHAGGGSRRLMLIVGCPHTRPMLGTYIFKAADFDLGHGKVVFRQCVIQAFAWGEPAEDPVLVDSR